MCTKRFGWKPPAHTGTGLRFNVLPVLMQAHPDEEPEMFEVPDQYVVQVPIRHPDNDAISALGMKWYAVPAVSCLELSVGGLTYTAAPFNGWYAETEIVRNITDEGRFNLTKAVATALGLDTKNNSSMWRDRAIVEVTVAVASSFREAGMGMVDHHTLMANFYRWYNREKTKRGFAPPGNWKWIITPVSPTASPCYLQLAHMTEFTLKPGYWYAPGWRKYLAAREAQAVSRPLDKRLSSGAAKGAALALPPATPAATILFIYASVTGNTQKYASAVASVTTSPTTNAVLLNMEDFEPDSWAEAIAAAQCVVVLSSTYGPGAPPGTATKFIAWLKKTEGEASEVFADKPFCIVGFGSSCYPRFCAAAELFKTLLLSVGATPLLPITKADALSGEEMTVWSWVKSLATARLKQGWIDGLQLSQLVQKLPMSDTDMPQPLKLSYRLVRLSGDGLRPAKQRYCHWSTVISNTELMRGPGAGKESSTRAITLDIENLPCGSYYAGDEISIWAENSAEVVDRFALNLGIAKEQLDDMFLLQKIEEDNSSSGFGDLEHLPLPNSFRTVLARNVGLSEPISFTSLVNLALCAPEDEKLQALAKSYNDYSNWVTDTWPRWQDLFELFPSLIQKISLPMFFELAPPVKPRYYSISSSSAVTASHVTLTVGRVAYKLPDGSPRSGFCSSYVTALQPGDKLRFRLSSQPAFRQPPNMLSPVIMVAAGTGIAPFKGFWEERLLRLEQGQVLGSALLVYGCRCSSQDLLYKAELDDMAKRGAITTVINALSREPGVPKTYVQDAILQSASRIKPMVADPRCHVYVCGTNNMAQEIVTVLSKMVGKPALEAMMLQGRYHEDVFGQTVPDHKAATKKAANKILIKSLADQPVAVILKHIGEGMELDAVDEGGNSLLHLAAARNRLDLASVLLSNRATVNRVNLQGLTALAVATIAGHAGVVAFLAASGGSRTTPLHKSFYPVHAAVMMEDAAALGKLLEDGAAPDALDCFEITPLHIAVSLGNMVLIKLLLDGKANPNLQMRSGLRPLQMAMDGGKAEVIELLKSRGGISHSQHVASSAATGGDVGDAYGKGDTASPDGPISDEEVAMVRASWNYLSGAAYPEKVEQAVEELGVSLFLALFEMYPTLLDMFPFKDANNKPIMADLRVHGKKVVSTLGEVVERLSAPDNLVRYVNGLVERHVAYGVTLEHYDVVLGVLLKMVVKVQLKDMSEEAVQAWQKALRLVKGAAVAFYKRTESAS